MKLLELNLEAFGPFTQQQMSFSSSEGHGLHLIYGKNEAGKSACLRALKALLYGIPARTSDNFLHANNKLRISATLEHSNGESLFIRRRKGRLNTLLDADNKVLDDAVLKPYLQGMDQTLFETLFALDHSALVQGGEAMLTQQGEVGQALFSAGMGIANLRQIAQGLEQEAKILYAPRAKKPEINTLMAEYKQCAKQIREQSLSAIQWKKQRKQLDDLEQSLQIQSDQLQSLKQQSHDLSRLQTIQALLKERKELVTRLNALGRVPCLSAHFTAQRIKALKTFEDSQSQIDALKTEQIQLEAKQATIQLNKPLLSNASALESLQQKVSSYINAQNELLQNQQEQQILEEDNQRLLGFLSPELGGISEFDQNNKQSLEQRLLAFLYKRQRLRALAEQQSSLQNTLQQTEIQQQKARNQLSIAQSSLEELPTLYDTQALRYSIQQTHKAGDLEQQRKQLIASYEKQYAHCKGKIQRLGLRSEDLYELEILPIPSMETVDRFKQQFQQNQTQLEQYQKQQQTNQQYLQQIEEALKALKLSGEVPTEEDLTLARSEREQLWQQVRQLTLTAKASEPIERKERLLNRFENHLNAADQLADRLRRESERVHKQADLLAQKDINSSQLDKVGKEIEQVLAQQTALDTQWQTLWQQTTLEPLPPKEMRAWLHRLQKLQEQVSELNQAYQTLEKFNQKYQEYCRLLEESLHYTGGISEGLKNSEYENIDWLLDQAEQRLETLRQTAEKQRAFNKEIKKQNQLLESAKQEHKIANKKWQQWQQQWQDLLKPLGLSDNMLGSEMNTLLDQINDWSNKRDKLQQLSKKADYLQQAINTFEQEYYALRQQLPLDKSTDLLPEQWIKKQYKALKEQQKQQIHLKNLQQKQQEKIISHKQWQQRLEESQTILNKLLKEANCDQIEDLEAIEQRVKQAQVLQSELKHLQQRLDDHCGESSLEELEIKLANYKTGQLSAEISQLEQQILEQEQQRDQLNKESGALAQQLQHSETQTGAINSLDDKHAVLAQMSDKVQTYLRLRLAQRILQQYIERYRQQHQGPVLKRAGEYFTTLSCHSFKGLGIDYDKNDQAILMGLRPNEELINIQGMSDGTRDQLYLALRFASLEQHLRNAEPLPFILDDILINFDNERVLASLKALSQLAQKTQVILFTHHQHLIDLFAQHQKQDFVLHEL